MKIKSFKRGSAFFMAAALCLGSTSGVYAMDQDELSRIIQEARNTDTSGYTPESCENLKDALEGAEALLTKENVTEEELGAGAMMLQAILENGLVSQADKSALEAALTEAASCTDTEEDGYEVLQSVCAQAQAVLEDGNATQAETDGAASAVVQAEDNLGNGVDKSVLSDLVSQAEALDTSGSDTTCAQQLKTAIASAKQVLANTSATQSMVDKHIQLLEAAAESLYEKTDANTVYDGVYQIGGYLHHATADQVSMGNSALVKPFELVKKGNDIHLRIECKALTTKLGSMSFTGYLAKMWYYPGLTSEDTTPFALQNEGQAVALSMGEAETEAEGSGEQTDESEEALFMDGVEEAGQEADADAESAGQNAESDVDTESADQDAEAETENAGQEAEKDTESAGQDADTDTESAGQDTEADTGASEQTAESDAEEISPEEDGAETSQEEETQELSESTEEEAADQEAAAEESGLSTQALEENVVPAAETATAKTVGVESYYNTYDSYNDPKTGTDANVKGKKYPHYITIPVQLNQSLVWTKIYVPVMEAINAGGGQQYAKLYLDWKDLTQISGTDADKTALKTGITKAQSVLTNLQKNSQGYAKEQITMLSSAINAAKAVYKNLNTDQTIVDNEVKTLTMAVNVVTKVEVSADKSELKKAIQVADSYLNEKDVDYTASTLEALKRARDNAQKVYNNKEASQTEINKCVTAVDNAIKGLVINGTDRRTLKKTLTQAKSRLAKTTSYTAADMNVLQSVYKQAMAVYKDKETSQDEVDAQVGVLNYIMENMKKVSESKVDKTGLYEMLLTASNMAGRQDTYTAATLKNLNAAITAAKSVYNNSSASQKQVNAQITKLSKAVSGLKKASGSNSNGNQNNNNNNNNNNNGNNNNNNNDNNSGNNSSLDVKNLEDGVYSVTGSMVKIDKTSASMSNEAINHTIKLTVKKGKYSLTMDFKGLTINGQLGYLGTLKYFKSGYKLDQYGSPSGSLGEVTVDSYQKYTDGKLVEDNFGTNYPDVVTFPLIEEAKSDGYVPLQVFVPIMDSITKGTGTQPTFLKLDWSTLKKTDGNDSSFKNDDSGNGDGSNSSNSNNTGNSSVGGNSSLSGNNGSLKTGGNSSLSGSGSKLSTNGSLSGNASKTGTSSLKSSGSLKSTGSTSSKSKTTQKSAGTTALKSGKSLSKKDSSSDTGVTKLTSSGLSETGEQDQETTASGEAYTEESTETSSGDMSKMAIPVSVSMIAALAGVFYKIKSRGGSLIKQARKRK